VTVVSNASPLITLSKVGALHVLPELFVNLIVATEVFREVTVIGAGRPGASDVQTAPWIEVRNHTNAAQFALLRAQHGLGAGETATARGLATGLGLSVMGCVGVLESAARKNLVPDLRRTYEQLLDSGTYIDRAILNRSLTSFNLPTLYQLRYWAKMGVLTSLMLVHFLIGVTGLPLWPACATENRQDACAITTIESGAPRGITLDYCPAFSLYESDINHAGIGHKHSRISKERGAELDGFG